MMEQFAPGGDQVKTPAPKVNVNDGVLSVDGVASGTSIGYRLNEGPWKLYSGKIMLTAADKIEVKAIRYGWKESDIVVAGPKSR